MNAITTVTAPPATVNEEFVGIDRNPPISPTEYPNVPFASVRFNEGESEANSAPRTVMIHGTPIGRPVSSKSTGYPLEKSAFSMMEPFVQMTPGDSVPLRLPGPDPLHRLKV